MNPKHVLIIDIELLEPLFFASREISSFYETEPMVGNYALVYALGLAKSPWRCHATPHYREDLLALRKRGVYVTPAGPTGAVRSSLTSFNALSDAYWYKMDRNVVNVEKGKRARPVNRPQIGRIKQLALGNRFRFALFSSEQLLLPSYIRLGKWMSKARLTCRRAKVELVRGRYFAGVETGKQPFSLPLNSFDLLRPKRVLRYDLTQIYPAPLLRNAVYEGETLRLECEGLPVYHYPAALCFGGPTWED